jgi:hypothetical protein
MGLIVLMVAAIIQQVRYSDSSAWIVIALGAFWLLVYFALKKLMDYNNKNSKK